MPAAGSVVVTGAVEGTLDEAVLVRLVEHVGAEPGPIHGKAGKQRILERLGGYNSAAEHAPWVVVVDLDSDADCAPPFRSRHLEQPSRFMCFRIAVRQIEAWLLADRERFAAWFSVAPSLIPANPEGVQYPKQHVVELVSHSRRRDIRQDMVPREGSGRNIGSAYTSRMIEFATDVESGWRPDVAVQHSDSLARCVTCIEGVRSSASALWGLT